MADQLLGEPVADGDRAGHRKVGDDQPRQPGKANEAWPATIERRKRRISPSVAMATEDDIDGSTRGDGR